MTSVSLSPLLWSNVTCIFSQCIGFRKMRDLGVFNDHLFNPREPFIPTKNSASWTLYQTRNASWEIPLVLGQFHHPGLGAQVKVPNSAYQLHANHLLATAAHSRPSIIVAPSWKSNLCPDAWPADDRWGFCERIWIHLPLCVCVRVCLKRSESLLDVHELFKFSWKYACDNKVAAGFKLAYAKIARLSQWMTHTQVTSFNH